MTRNHRAALAAFATASALMCLSLLASMQPASALNLGSVAKNDFADVSAGGIARFSLLFWSRDEDGCQVDLKVKSAPKNWEVVIDPQAFIVSPSTKGELMYLQDETIGALPVTVLVKPNITTTGTYDIVLAASASVGSGQGAVSQGVGIQQERVFILSVAYSSGPNSADGSTSAISGSQSKIGTDLASTNETLANATGDGAGTGLAALADQGAPYVFYLAVIFCILVVSLIIYEYA